MVFNPYGPAIDECTTCVSSICEDKVGNVGKTADSGVGQGTCIDNENLYYCSM